MRDAIGRPALARAVIEGRTISIEIATAQAPEELSVSIYHELLEAMTVGSSPRRVRDGISMKRVLSTQLRTPIGSTAWQIIVM